MDPYASILFLVLLTLFLLTSSYFSTLFPGIQRGILRMENLENTVATKRDLANAVATVSRQLESVHEALAAAKRHLTKRLEKLDKMVEEEMETIKLIANDVNEMKTNISQIGFDAESIHQMVSGLEEKIKLIERKQDLTFSSLLCLCQAVEGFKDKINTKVP